MTYSFAPAPRAAVTFSISVSVEGVLAVARLGDLEPAARQHAGEDAADGAGIVDY